MLSITPVSAIYFGSGNNLYLSADNKFNETVVVAGEKLTIDSSINGDLVCAGKDITISGDVTGDIYCVGQNITYKGKVKGDVLTAGENINIFSLVGRDLAAAGSKVTLNSNITRNATLAGSEIITSLSSKIVGNLDYYVNDSSTTKFEGTIAGQSNKHLIATESKSVSTTPVFGSLKIFTILATLVSGFALLFFSNQFTLSTSTVISTRPVVTFFIGFSALIVIPILSLILMFTLAGLPLGFILLLLYFIAIISASIFPSLSFGQWLLKLTKIGGTDYLAMLVGVVVLQLAMLIPVIGWIFGLFLLCEGLGGFFQNFLPIKKTDEIKKTN